MHGISKTTLRLRQVDIKADHFERQTQNLERERDLWEKKYEVRVVIMNGGSPLFGATTGDVHETRVLPRLCLNLT